MTSENEPDSLEEKQRHNRKQRIEAVKRWVAYIQSEPPEVWGPQQNAIVESQLDAAQSAELSADHKQRVSDVAQEILDEKSDESE